MLCSWSHARMWINRYKKYYCRAAAQSFLVYFCEKIRCGTNVARLRISVWFVGDPEVICPGSGLVQVGISSGNQALKICAFVGTNPTGDSYLPSCPITSSE